MSETIFQEASFQSTLPSTQGIRDITDDPKYDNIADDDTTIESHDDNEDLRQKVNNLGIALNEPPIPKGTKCRQDLKDILQSYNARLSISIDYALIVELFNAYSFLISSTGYFDREMLFKKLKRDEALAKALSATIIKYFGILEVEYKALLLTALHTLTSFKPPSKIRTNNIEEISDNKNNTYGEENANKQGPTQEEQRELNRANAKSAATNIITDIFQAMSQARTEAPRHQPPSITDLAK